VKTNCFASDADHCGVEKNNRPFQRVVILLLRSINITKVLLLLAKTGVVLGVDCHTMAGIVPPVSPDPGKERPAVNLGDANGSIPAKWCDSLMECFRQAFSDHKVTLNDPFSGGYITQAHAAEMPW
jgi:N-formylglutamate amidohydrolase